MIKQTFNTCKDYVSFSLARSFRYTQDPEKEFPPSKLEKFSQKALAPLQWPLDQLLRNINSPILVVAINIVGIAATTIFFYPDKSFKALQTACSPLFHLEPWMMKFGAYLTSEFTITSLMIRTLDRLNRQDLLDAWKKKEITPIHLGQEIISTFRNN